MPQLEELSQSVNTCSRLWSVVVDRQLSERVNCCDVNHYNAGGMPDVIVCRLAARCVRLRTACMLRELMTQSLIQHTPGVIIDRASAGQILSSSLMINWF